MGADVILSPCAWPADSDNGNDKHHYGDLWRESFTPVAKAYSTAIIGVSNVGIIEAGPWKGKKCIGCSLAISASGEATLHGTYGVDAECILYIDVNGTPGDYF